MTIQSRAAEIGTTARTLSTWKRDGIDIFDDAAVKAHIASLRTVPININDAFRPPAPVDAAFTCVEDIEAAALTAPDYATARTLRMQMATLRDATREKQDRGELISLAEISEARQRDGYAIRQMLLDMLGTIPPAVVGLPHEAAVEQVMRPILYQVMQRFHEGHAGYWPTEIPADLVLTKTDNHKS